MMGSMLDYTRRLGRQYPILADMEDGLRSFVSDVEYNMPIEALGPNPTMFFEGAGLQLVRGTQATATTSQTTILGENMAQRVIPFAEQTGARTIPFGATVDEWAAMTARQRWKLNDGTLRARINEGDAFKYIGQDPLRNPALRTQFDLTGSELLRLNARGIPYETVAPSEVMSVINRP